MGPSPGLCFVERRYGSVGTIQGPEDVCAEPSLQNELEAEAVATS